MAQNLSARLSRLQRLQNSISQKIQRSQSIRLALGLCIFTLALISASRKNPSIELIGIVLLIVAFVLFLRRTRALQQHRFQLSTLAFFYQRQWARQQGKPIEKTNFQPENYKAAFPPQSGDLDLLGSPSVLTLIDETLTDGGQQKLVDWMLSSPASLETIRQRQVSVQNMKKERWTYIRLILLAAGTENELKTLRWKDLLENEIVPPLIRWRLIWVFVAWALMLAAFALKTWIGGFSPSLFVLLFLILNFALLNKIGPVFLKGLGVAESLQSLASLFAKIEKCSAHSGWVKAMPETARFKPSRNIKIFGRVLDFLSVEAHPIIYLVLNAILPWTVFFSILLERQRQKLQAKLPSSLRELYEVEALMSLALVNVYQTSTFPMLESAPCLKATKIFHPLIERSRVVRNDFRFESGQTLGLLTGSNMSGKSTFLRTIGVNQVLANMGAPVFAESMTTSLFEISTCIRVSDSLRDGFSYFYSEVLRLKNLIETVRSGAPVLFLIDEIFRGTNNLERQIGSRAVIRGLVRPNCLGFVSTHDLELTRLAEETPAIVNLHFREAIENGEMKFSYQLNPGPCPTTNALVIMKKAGLPLDDEN